MSAKEEKIKITLRARIRLEFLAKRIDYNTISEYLDAITNDPRLCVKIEKHLERTKNKIKKTITWKKKKYK